MPTITDSLVFFKTTKATVRIDPILQICLCLSLPAVLNVPNARDTLLSANTRKFPHGGLHKIARYSLRFTHFRPKANMRKIARYTSIICPSNIRHIVRDA